MLGLTPEMPTPTTELVKTDETSQQLLCSHRLTGKRCATCGQLPLRITPLPSIMSHHWKAGASARMRTMRELGRVGAEASWGGIYVIAECRFFNVNT